MIPRSQHFGDRAPFPFDRSGIVRIFEEAVLEASSAPLEGAPITPGSSRMQASSSMSAAGSPPDRTTSPTETSSISRAAKMRSSKPSKRPHSRITPGPAASSRTRACVSGLPRGVMAMTGRARLVRLSVIDRRAQHIDPQHHSRAAARRRVVDGAVLVDREVADLDGVERPLALRQGAAGEADAERAREHLRIKREHGGGEGHRRTETLPIFGPTKGAMVITTSSSLRSAPPRPRNPPRCSSPRSPRCSAHGQRAACRSGHA